MPRRPDIPAPVKRQVLVESGHRCAVCGFGSGIEFAHIRPWHRSDEYTNENVICLCAGCHARADREKWGEHTLRQYKEKPWVARQFEQQESSETGGKVKVTLTIDVDLDLDDVSKVDASLFLSEALAGFLNVAPKSVRIDSTEEG